MRFLAYLAICFSMFFGQAFAQDEITIPVHRTKRDHKPVKVKPSLGPQSKKTLSLEEKKQEIIQNPDPAIFNDIRDATSGNVAEEPLEEENSSEQAQSKLRTDFSSMGSELKVIMKNHNLMIGNTPYSLQGLPIIYTSKSTGFNLGLRMSIADMKYEQPYVYKLGFQFWVSDRGVRNHELELDVPQFFTKHWHISLDYKYLTVIDNNYFGIGNNSAFNQDLITPYNPSFISRTYYQYTLTYPKFTFNVEYKLFSEIFSVYTGIGLERATINPHNLDNTSKIYIEKPFGYNGGNTNYIKVGVKFDTRDYPFNPTKGVVLAGIYTDHTDFIGSNYQYKNLDLTFMWFTSFWRYFTLGHRILIDQIWGNPPFFALAEFRSYENYEGLGGSDTLRGAPTFRFIDNLKFINQIEIRTRLSNGTVFGQHLEINVNPFWDLGRVWDRKKRVTFDGFHDSFGSEFRFTWNANFITAVTVGVSHDGTSTNLSFGESFK